MRRNETTSARVAANLIRHSPSVGARIIRCKQWCEPNFRVRRRIAHSVADDSEGGRIGRAMAVLAAGNEYRRRRADRRCDAMRPVRSALIERGRVRRTTGSRPEVGSSFDCMRFPASDDDVFGRNRPGLIDIDRDDGGGGSSSNERSFRRRRRCARIGERC
uniref:Uncharacterized protein n=1 Tax=Plectus sambesii TaxID=2011161 RepID=A0A914XAM9_9BILA